MATAEPIAEGLMIRRSPAGFEASEQFMVTGCTGATQREMLATAFGATSLPAYNSSMVVTAVGMSAAQTLYAKEFSASVWGNEDAVVTVNWRPPGVGSGGGGLPASQVLIDVSTTLEQTETDFDAANRALPFTSRVPITVRYDPSSNGAPATVGTATAYSVVKNASVRGLFPRSTITYTTTENTDPSAESRAYVGRTNNATWKGLIANSMICMAITGRSNDGGLTYQVTRTFAYDPDDLWQQVATITVDGERPGLTPAQVQNQNGVKRVIVQGEADFSLLPI